MAPGDGTVEAAMLRDLTAIVGHAHVLTGRAAERHTTGFRYGGGAALAVVRPGSLVEQWRVLLLCVQAGAAIVLQSANTGLTGGSTPFGDYGRPVVLINTLRMDIIHPITGGTQVICLPGATLHALEKLLRPLGREPHSIIGSSCIGASVMGGVCNNSGGALVHRGPAYTELALYARLDEDGQLRLVNHLGIDLGDDPETALDRLERGAFTDADIVHDPDRAASDRGYRERVRDIDSPTPARFNADPKQLFEASGCAGKLAVFAVRLDSFPAEIGSFVFYVGTNSTEELTRLRRDILSTFAVLPIAGEYMHRTAFDIAARYCKDMFLAIRWLGTDRLPTLFALKARIDGALGRLGVRKGFCDRLLQALSQLMPAHLPPRMIDFRRRFEHHLMIRVSAASHAEMRDYFAGIFPSADGDVFECTTDEGDRAFLHRFAAAGAAIRYHAVHAPAVGDIVALDIALPRNERNWFESLPDDLDRQTIHKLYYGHFFCHVLHQDYILAPATDPIEVKQRLLALLDRRGVQYPAEHNVGHLYHAADALVDFYRRLDPHNQFNPGIGHSSRRPHWL